MHDWCLRKTCKRRAIDWATQVKKRLNTKRLQAHIPLITGTRFSQILIFQMTSSSTFFKPKRLQMKILNYLSSMLPSANTTHVPSLSCLKPRFWSTWPSSLLPEPLLFQRPTRTLQVPLTRHRGKKEPAWHLFRAYSWEWCRKRRSNRKWAIQGVFLLLDICLLARKP